MDYPILGRVIPPVIGLWIKRITGVENIPKNGSYIVAANHASYIDHLILSSIIVTHTGKKIHYLAKKEHFETVFQRLWHEHVGAIPTDREKGGKKALKTAIKYLKNDKIISIYPEGTRTLTGKLNPGKTGIARLVMEAKVPVLPIGLIGTFKILPKGKRIPRFTRAQVRIGKLMYFDNYRKDYKSLRKITDNIMLKIAELCKQKYTVPK
ncbi:MAG: lysophospholipid acyltransferase family protein [Nanoarchaeota archaeon]